MSLKIVDTQHFYFNGSINIMTMYRKFNISLTYMNIFTVNYQWLKFAEELKIRDKKIENFIYFPEITINIFEQIL